MIESCEHGLDLLAKSMLLTGARPGELAAMNISDFDSRLGAITLRGKTGERIVAVSTEAARFFAERGKNKIGQTPMLSIDYGHRWNKDSWKKIFKKAVEKAGLPEFVVLYSIRYTAISEMILAGMDSLIVAKLVGTAVAMIESNYGHLRHT